MQDTKEIGPPNNFGEPVPVVLLGLAEAHFVFQVAHQQLPVEFEGLSSCA